MQSRLYGDRLVSRLCCSLVVEILEAMGIVSERIMNLVHKSSASRVRRSSSVLCHFGLVIVCHFVFDLLA